MGGIALGKGVMSSGLLDVVDDIIHDLVHGVSLYGVVLILSPVVLVGFLLIPCERRVLILSLRLYPLS